MILDERLEMCDATALNTGAAGTYLLGDVIDLSLVNRDVGIGEDLYFVFRMQAAATSGGSATGQFALASDAQAAIATNGTATIHALSPAIAVASLTAGRLILAGRLPIGTYERYLGVLQTTAVAAFTGGAIDAFLTYDFAKWEAYADAVNF